MYRSNNDLYLKSNRNYSADYSKIKSQKIDMTLSGKYLGSYPNIKIDSSYFDKYPMSIDSKKLEEIIRKKYKITSSIILGNGANGLLQNLVKLFFKGSGNLITPFYSFDQAEFAVTSFDGITKRVFTCGYEINLENMKKAKDEKTKLVYLCNPNNPTGKYINSKILIKFAKEVKIPVVVDESGIEITKNKSLLDYHNLPNNLIIIRSFSKVYGLANFRIGFMVCSNKFKKIYEKDTTTNEYSGISCLMAQEMLLDSEKNIDQNIKKIIEERKKIFNSLKEIGIECIDSCSNLLLTSTYFKQELLDELVKKNISIVPVYDKMKNLHIRIAVQDTDTNNAFLNGIKKIVEEKELIIGVYND